MTESTGPTASGADIHWQGDIPVSRHFGDVYYSRDDGRGETRHVFLEGNDLPGRWRRLPPGAAFTLGETGFGTGLNFLCAAHLWLESAPPDCRLHYVAVEKYPLAAGDCRRALSAWPELEELTSELIANYPPPVAGGHRLWLAGDRICLTLFFADAGCALTGLTGSDDPRFARVGNPAVDAWFLDGFAPARNPGLWTPDLFGVMARLSAPGTTFATFTAARAVRRGLQEAGFQVDKVRGFGRKRDMLRGRYAGGVVDSPPGETVSRRNSPWPPPWHVGGAATRDKRALVLGAGIAGCATARALDRRGWSVTLVDRHARVAGEASGNPQGILYPKLSKEDSPLALFGRQALCHALHFYRDYWRTNQPGDACGVMVLPESDRDRRDFAVIGQRHPVELVRLLQGEAVSQAAGLPLAGDLALFYPGLGWVAPAQVCRTLARGLPYRQAEVADIRYDGKTASWQLLDENRGIIANAPNLVLACGHGTGRFDQTRHLPLKPLRGQISIVPANRASESLKAVVCGSAYLAPARDGYHTLGATYTPEEVSDRVRDEDHRQNLAAIAATDAGLASVFDGIPADQLDGRAGLRCTTPDYLPVAGPAPRHDAFVEDFGALAHNARADIPRTGRYWPGLYLNCGHGSRGLTYAPQAAEVVADEMDSKPSPLERDLRLAIHPARFIVRDLKRGRITLPENSAPNRGTGSR